ncbi:uncharacterized protein LOC110845563 isoform X1 [Folsomia candida]|uniref:uncharacterized protein LOC110845563 isoform X1 n=1 Tax=Folsomia candida TaxID=158441 RepID=UPI001604BAE8|nr:uncharacterized protein LOC110845563 isoform X1 [Folsomia candida]XP_035705134.1 uncharacterized protein LOC110845563 isoform X1 [Folsomia candida]XP_035705135.1 uncharacterized protein LOC110845563 isoform X1 [Folsomia candida]XP_035705136.1 uncharacterized protein LOC110845563 isoform X1 [Folsomia candida]XP_035705137.1 uncharacterized protein LOC110845563 isoform X1 [Folsomia candida]XP_035705138.1 uncharacterized protein LOC110845563 isoform X1 [Folsomia candida]
MMPFLHDGNASVTITPTNGGGASDLLQKFIKQENLSKSFSGNTSANLQKIVRNSVPSIVEFQRKAAHKKLQIAKMMGNGGMTASVPDFRKHQGHQNHQSMMSEYNDPMQVASRRARSNNFTLNETFALLKIWASPEMQWQMKHNFRNFRVWEAISFAMQELGHDRTAIQCKNRIQNLTSIYYRIKKTKQDYRSFNFPYYKIIGDVLDGKKNGSNATMPPNMAEFIQHFTTNASGVVSPTQVNSGVGHGSSGMAAHMALVEEYQHLINGNPEVTMTSTGERSSSSNGTNGMNVLSPEVSISEGDSPIRMDSQQTIRSNSQSASTSAQKNHTGSNSNNSPVNRNSNANGSSSSSGVKHEQEDGGLEDGSIPSENENHEVSDFDDGTMYNADEETMAMLGRAENYSGCGRGKRSMLYPKGTYNNGIPTKRPRGLSSATTASTSGVAEDPIGQYLSEMVDIEREWLNMERERAENERQMMLYMMQILQALICPDQEQEEEGNEDGTMEGNDNEAEATENEYTENENENDDSEIREMIEQQENLDTE